MKIISEKQLATISRDDLLALIKDRGVFLHMFDGSLNECRVRDVIGDLYTIKIIDYVGLSFFLKSVEYIEVMEDKDCPKIVL